MSYTKSIEKGVFADIIEKIQLLTESQQRFLQEILARREKVFSASKKNLLKKSFGLWTKRRDINGSIDYVNNIRKGWESRLDRIND